MKERLCSECSKNTGEYLRRCTSECLPFYHKPQWTVSTRAVALRIIDEERNRQDAKWGIQDHAQQAWVGILGEEYGEYCQAVNETYLGNATKKHEGGYENLLKELTHVAAVAVGAIECLMRNRGNE